MAYFKAIFGLALAVSAITVSAGAQAERPDAAVPRVVVRIADLDLRNAADEARLVRRLRRAAEQVCEPLEARDLARATRHAACLRDALAGAQAQLAQLRLAKVDRAVDTGSR